MRLLLLLYKLCEAKVTSLESSRRDGKSSEGKVDAAAADNIKNHIDMQLTLEFTLQIRRCGLPVKIAVLRKDILFPYQ